MTNPIFQSAYSLEELAPLVGVNNISELRKKVIKNPEDFPPHTIVGRTKQHDGGILFSKKIFEEWLEANAVRSRGWK